MFTIQNHSTPQRFTVTAGSDGDADDDSMTVSHSASGGGYDGAAIDGVSVTVNDDKGL